LMVGVCVCLCLCLWVSVSLFVGVCIFVCGCQCIDFMVAVTKEDTKKDLRVKTKGNQEKTLEILLEAVKGGMTVQEARMGMVIAQFEALDDATKKEAMEKAKQRQDRMPSGARTKMNERLELKNKKERDQLTALKTDAEKEDFVKRIYRPRYNMATV